MLLYMQKAKESFSANAVPPFFFPCTGAGRHLHWEKYCTIIYIYILLKAPLKWHKTGVCNNYAEQVCKLKARNVEHAPMWLVNNLDSSCSTIYYTHSTTPLVTMKHFKQKDSVNTVFSINSRPYSLKPEIMTATKHWNNKVACNQ